jgi:hypothetical protein
MFFSGEKALHFCGAFFMRGVEKNFGNREHFFDFGSGRKTEFCSAQFRNGDRQKILGTGSMFPPARFLTAPQKP